MILTGILVLIMAVGALLNTGIIDFPKHEENGEPTLQVFEESEEASNADPQEALKLSPTAAPSMALAGDDDLDKIRATFDSHLNSAAGDWNLYFESLGTHKYSCETSLGIGADGAVAASLIKLFIMAAVYQDIDTGVISHDAVYPLIHSMISASDNEAANRLITTLGSGDPSVGMKKVTAYASAIGCDKTKLNRQMLDFNGAENYVSAGDCGKLLQLIYNGECINEKWSAEMLECLKAQTVNNRIPALLPEGTIVAHKTGDLSNLSCGDAAIVFTPYGDYILCAISNNSPNDAQTATDIANLSAMIYHQYTGS